MNRDNIRLTVHPGPNGIGEHVVDITYVPHAQHHTAAAWRIYDSLCTRCHKPLGRDVFVTVDDLLYHLACVKVGGA